MTGKSKHEIDLAAFAETAGGGASSQDAMPEETRFPALTDTACMEDERCRDRRLVAELTRAFEDMPVEDGVEHPAERIIDEALGSRGACALERLGRLANDAERPEFAASVLRCLSRRQPETAAWRADVVRTALAADDVEMRDAAVQAAESWGGAEVRRVLRGHTETVPWLRAYIEDVVEDLEA